MQAMTEGLGSARAATILGLVGVGPPAGPRYWRLQRRGGGWNATAWAAFQGASVWAACQWQLWQAGAGGGIPANGPERHAPAVTVAPLRAVDSAGPWSGPWCSLSSSLVSRKRGAQRRPSESNGDFAASGLPLPSLWPEPRAAGCSVQFTAPPLLHGSAKLHFASTCPIEAISASAAS